MDADVASFFDDLMDFELFCKNHLKIKTKNGEILPFVFNKPQRKLYNDFILPALNNHKLLRLLILKARQEGVSTLIEALYFWLSITQFNIKGVVIAHKSEASQGLYDMYRRFYNHLAEGIKPETETTTQQGIKFSNLQSEMKIMTAESRSGTGRSETVQLLHISELDFYPDPKTTLTGLMPTATNAHIIIESTANGLGNLLYKLWQDAVSGNSAYTPVFLAWWEMEEYCVQLSPAEEKAFAKTLTTEEKEAIDLYGLSMGQVAWRRQTIQEICFGDSEQFKQEYPSNPIEAFLASGRPVFDRGVVGQEYVRTKDLSLLKFNLHETAEGMIKAEPNERGYWKMCYPFTVGEGERYRFAVGTDVAEGLEQGDYSSMDVLDRTSMQYVLKFHGHIDADLLAYEQYKLGRWLKDSALFCTEKNNHGLTTITHAREFGVPQFYQVKYDKGYIAKTDELGFRTSTVSRPVMLGELVEAVRTNAFKDNDKDFWIEASTFVYNEKGKMEAQGKSKGGDIKDDRIFSKALSLVCNQWMPRYVQMIETEEERSKREYNEWARKNKIKSYRSRQKGKSSY